eukprot:2543893-Rhodomonas_salina.2
MLRARAAACVHGGSGGAHADPRPCSVNVGRATVGSVFKDATLLRLRPLLPSNLNSVPPDYTSPPGRAAGTHACVSVDSPSAPP